MPQSDTAGAMQLGEDLRAAVAEGSPSISEQGTATISIGITMFGGKRDAGAEAVLVAADQAMYRAKEEGRNRVALFDGSGCRARSRPAQSDDDREDPRRADPEPAQSRHAADPQPRLRRHRALRAAAADDRGGRRAAAGRLLHRGGGALGHGAGAGSLGRRPGAGAAGRARARRRAGLAPRQPLGRLADRYLRASSSSSDASTRATPIPAAAPSRSPRPPRSRITSEPPALPTASPSSAAKSRSTITAPASVPSTT